MADSRWIVDRVALKKEARKAFLFLSAFSLLWSAFCFEFDLYTGTEEELDRLLEEYLSDETLNEKTLFMTNITGKSFLQQPLNFYIAFNKESYGEPIFLIACPYENEEEFVMAQIDHFDEDTVDKVIFSHIWDDNQSSWQKNRRRPDIFCSRSLRNSILSDSRNKTNLFKMIVDVSFETLTEQEVMYRCFEKLNIGFLPLTSTFFSSDYTILSRNNTIEIKSFLEKLGKSRSTISLYIVDTSCLVEDTDGAFKLYTADFNTSVLFKHYPVEVLVDIIDILQAYSTYNDFLTNFWGL